MYPQMSRDKVGLHKSVKSPVTVFGNTGGLTMKTGLSAKRGKVVFRLPVHVHVTEGYVIVYTTSKCS